MFKLDSLDKIDFDKKIVETDELYETLNFLGKSIIEKTNRILNYKITKVKFEENEKNISLDFFITAPNLQNLSYNLFSVNFNIFNLYPLEIIYSFKDEKSIICRNKTQLENCLNNIFSYDEAVSILTKMYLNSK